jgi:hypothetical protein
MGGGSNGGTLRGRSAQARPSSARTGAGGVAQFGRSSGQSSTVNRAVTFSRQTLGTLRGRTAGAAGRISATLNRLRRSA